ncbi:hypothetical protein ACTMTJ_07670 [Phytohabitans sp. LJ34]|uniref:hypothetical protein n=1 Tax=Phytohabitans sp. LJ34 TaxID=3452217 RepID=UPI003F89B3F0
MARKSKVAERVTVGIVLVALVLLFWVSDQRRLAIFVALALFVPYLALVAPFKCGGYTRQRKACRLIGCGLLIGCRHHRFDRIGRIFGHDRDQAATTYEYPDQPVHAAQSGGIPTTPAGQPTRLRAFDMLSLAVGASSMIAGWLALWIGPS